MILDRWPARRRQDENGKASSTQVLLVSKVLIGRDHHVKRCFCDVQQFTVTQFSPPHLKGGGDRVIRQKPPQRDGCPLVEQYFQGAATRFGQIMRRRDYARRVPAQPRPAPGSRRETTQGTHRPAPRSRCSRKVPLQVRGYA